MTAPSAHTASPPQTSVSSAAVFARTNVCFSTRCVMASSTQTDLTRLVNAGVARAPRAKRQGSVAHSARLGCEVMDRLRRQCRGDRVRRGLLGPWLQGPFGGNHAEKAELPGHRH